MKHLLVAVCLVLAAFACRAATSTTDWIGPDGGSWNNPDNWSNGLPYFTSNTDYKSAQFRNAGDATLHVVIDADTKIAGFSLLPADGYDAENIARRLVLTGDKKLTLEFAIDVYDGRELVIDGPTVTFNTARTNRSKITVRSGLFKATVVIRGNTSGGILSVEGGIVETQTLNQLFGDAIMTVHQTGGSLRPKGWTPVKGEPAVQNGTFVQTGGEFVYGNDLAIDDRTSDRLAHTLHDQSFDFGGRLVVTNQAASRIFLCGDNLALRGGGTYVAPEFWFVQPTTVTAANPDVLTLDAAAIYLSRYFQAATHYPHTIRLPRQVTLGGFAWPAGSETATGDWTVLDTSSALTFVFEKGVTFDTTDYLDKTSSRTLSMSRAVLAEGAEVNVTGNGTASLQVVGNKPRLSKLSVGPGATYDVKGHVRTARLDIGAGGVLSITAGNRLEVDDEAAGTVAADARIDIVVPSTLTANAVLVYVASSASTGLADRFRIVGDSRGYALKTVGGCVYLAKDRTAPASAGWRGTVDSQVSDPANWSDGVIPYGSTKTVVLKDTLNPILVNDMKTVSNKTWSVVRFRADTELPFLLTGEPVSVTGTAYVHPNGQFYAAYNAPFYIDVDASSANSMSAISVSDSFALFSQDVTLSGALYVVGDVRVSGSLTCKYVYLCDGTADALDSTYPIVHQRPTELTICRGGTATVSAPDITKNVAGSYCVKEGGTLTLSSGVLGWNAMTGAPTVNVPTNRIDGTLGLGAALGGAGEICFSGSGTINLSGDALNAAKNTQGARVVAGSALTLAFAEEGSLATDWTVEPGASLTISPYGNVFTLNGPIAGAGAVSFAAGTKIALGDALAATVKSAGRQWTTLLNVGAGRTPPPVTGVYRTRVTESGDLQVRAFCGMAVIYR